MRIAVVSTYPPIECGIATYSENLCGALEKAGNEIFVVSQHGAEGRHVYPAYDPSDGDIASEIFSILCKRTPDLVHVQHEFGLYGAQHGVQANELLMRLELVGMPVAVTLHTVRSPMPQNDRIILEGLLRDSSLVVVHEERQKSILEEAFGPSDSIRVIPHGIRDVPPVEGAKGLLGLRGKKVALLVGYFRPSKRFDRIVRLWPRVVERNPDAVLLIAGKMRGIEYSEYREELLAMARESPAAESIKCLRGQFPQHTFDTLLSAADCVVMPYEEGAQSGILANAAAFRVPVVTSDLESFALWNEWSGGGLTASSDDDFVECISKVLFDDELRRRMGSSLDSRIASHLWDAVARRHLEAYEEIIDPESGNIRYFYVPET